MTYGFEKMTLTLSDTDAIANRALSLRGYIVAGSSEPLRIGEVVPLNNHAGPDSSSPVAVIAETDRADLIAQCHALGFSHVVPMINAPYFYRFLAE